MAPVDYRQGNPLFYPHYYILKQEGRAGLEGQIRGLVGYKDIV